MNTRMQLLTPRQAEVVKSVVEGRSSPKIAAEMGVTMQTIKFHLAEAYRTLGVHSRYELITMWYDHELADARRFIKQSSLLALHDLALWCAHEMAGYAVEIEPGSELEVIERRLAQLEHHCRSYGRSLQNLHRQLDAAA